MKSLEKLYNVKPCFWLDSVTRKAISDGTINRYIDDRLITGVYLNSQALRYDLEYSDIYDKGVQEALGKGIYGEELACSLLFTDLGNIADQMRVMHDRTNGHDGWAVLPLSPLMTTESDHLTSLISSFHARIQRPNALISIGGLPQNMTAIEETVYMGIPCNIDLIFSAQQLCRVSEACLRGIERRVGENRSAAVPVFATICLSEITKQFLDDSGNELAISATIAAARRIYRVIKQEIKLHWKPLLKRGARPLKIAWDMTGNGLTPEQLLVLIAELSSPETVMIVSEDYIDAVSRIDNVRECALNNTTRADVSIAMFDYANHTHELQLDLTALEIKSWIALLETCARTSVRVVQDSGFMKPTVFQRDLKSHLKFSIYKGGQRNHANRWIYH